MHNFDTDFMGRPSTYDWVEPGQTRTPEEYPYNFDAHFKWREFDKLAHDEPRQVFYSDRMLSWDYEKYMESFGSHGWLTSLTKEQCKKAVETYFGASQECVGFALCCNQSTGYPIGIFFVKPKQSNQAGGSNG
ncbi:hypothetical protein GCM10007094_23110 [Pseudovibrio japonicus]|uniref:Uncharacterized protein n=1 Tax=Pseudovibrio japonicus TaxID=366534 RepID=A0ABQ3EGV5_9HYPH|nr:hypothetical protein [Pseudovibrio japonicus]GHB33689.1 hypothetical protein GCM10007094_23110 [Pseudovibrio japonicus]